MGIFLIKWNCWIESKYTNLYLTSEWLRFFIYSTKLPEEKRLKTLQLIHKLEQWIQKIKSLNVLVLGHLIGKQLNRKNDKEMGQREELSHLDITKISRMYECNRRPQFGFGLGSIASGIFSATQSGNHLAARPKPPTNSAGNSGFSSGSNSGAASAFAGREDFGQWNPFKDIFNTYTSPRFWQRFIGSWLSQQPQPRQQTYNDYPYPYSFGQNLGQDYYYG